MKYENRLSYLNALLNILLVVLALPFITILYVPFTESINMKQKGQSPLLQN